MFKNLVLSLLLPSLFFLIGCRGIKEENKENKEVKERVQSIYFDNSIAIEVAKEYMEALKDNNIDKIKVLSDKDIEKSIKVLPNKSCKIGGIKLISTAQMGNKTLFKFNITRNRIGEPNSTLEEYYLEVMKNKEGEYKVSKLKSKELYEVFLEGDRLKLRKDNEVSLGNLIDLKSLPDKIYPKVNLIDITKVSVPKEKFSPLEISFSGDKVAISTLGGEDSYIGIVEVQDSKETLAKEGEEGEEEVKEEKEDKNVGKNIVSLDVLKGCKVSSLNFSGDDLYLIVNYIKGGATRFKIYETSGNIISLDLEDKFSEEEYNVIYEKIKNNEIIINVTKILEEKNDESDLTGRYKISLKDFKLEKL